VQSETLNYDSENRMTSFVSGSTTTSYVYDGDGRRVKKVTGTETVVFVYNAGGQLIAEYGQPQGSGGTSYLTSDHLGSTRLVTDGAGVVKARHDYLPFGEETGAGVGQRTGPMGYGAMDSTRQRFTSKERDQESGLDYFLARYYSASQGRFINPDEFTGGPDELYDFAQKASTNPTFYADIVDPQTLNKYQYCLNNPFKYIDPDGHQQKKSLTERLKESTGAVAESYGVSSRPFKDGDDPKDNPHSLENKTFGPSGELPLTQKIVRKAVEDFQRRAEIISDIIELLDVTGSVSIVRSATKGDTKDTLVAVAAAFIPTRNIGSKISQEIITTVAGSQQGKNILASGGRKAAKELFKQFAEKTGRTPITDTKGGGRGVAGKLADGTEIRIRFKRDGSTRIQVGKDKFIFPK